MREGLKVTGTTSPIVVGEGSARVHDKIHYWNTGDEYIEIPTPDRLPRIDCIVLRTDWEKQTVRLARIEGIEGEEMPVLATGINDGIQDAPLAQCLVTLSGILTVIDTWEDIKTVSPWDKAKTARSVK